MAIDVKPDFSERIKYNTAGFPAYYRKGLLSAYPDFSAERHWHDDVELIAVLSGEMSYNVNGETVKIEEGNGIFVNARQFHYGFSESRTECEFLCVLMHPMLLAASQYIEQKFVAPVLNDDSFPYYKICGNTERGRKILDAVKNIFITTDFGITALFYEIWEVLLECKRSDGWKPQAVKNSKLNLLKEMVSFIQNNYKEKISLSDIAESGAVCKTECCEVFRKFTNLTPVMYLNDFRLRKSAELLTQTDLTVTEICYETGFSGASYFTEAFKKTFYCTPREYRRRNCKKQ